MKTTYIFLADGFEEVEALTCVDVMRRAGMPVVTMSIYETPEAIGAHGVTVVADEAFDPDLLEDAEWVVCPGGMPGASNLAENETLCEILKERNEADENIAAICASPSVIFGPLGVLNGRNATCYPGMEDGMEGANLSEDFAVVDGNIITGRGPAAAAEFALAIVKTTMCEDVAADVAAGMLL